MNKIESSSLKAGQLGGSNATLKSSSKLNPGPGNLKSGVTNLKGNKMDIKNSSSNLQERSSFLESRKSENTELSEDEVITIHYYFILKFFIC